MSGLIERLDPARFEPVVLCSKAIRETIRRAVKRNDLLVVGFSDRFDEAVRTTRVAERSDVLFEDQAVIDEYSRFYEEATSCHTSPAASRERLDDHGRPTARMPD